MTNFYKANHYNVGDLLAVLQNIPKDYKIEVYADDFESHCGVIDDIDVDRSTAHGSAGAPCHYSQPLD